ncbi:hypothetical protein ACKWTF_015706 [Chironomus riparius]
METFAITSFIILFFHQEKKLRKFHLLAVILSVLFGDIEIFLAFLASFCILNDDCRHKIDRNLTKFCDEIGRLICKQFIQALKMVLKLSLYASKFVIQKTFCITFDALKFLYRQIAA